MLDTIFHTGTDFYPAIDRAITKYPFDPRASQRVMAEAGYTRGNERIQQRAQMAKLISDEVPAIMLTENPNMHANLATVRNVIPKVPYRTTGRITWNIHQWELAAP